MPADIFTQLLRREPDPQPFRQIGLPSAMVLWRQHIPLVGLARDVVCASLAPTAAGENVQIVLNGLVDGAVIALMAMAFQAVYLPTRILHFSLAGLYTLTPYLLASFTPEFGVVGGAVAAVAAIVLISLALEAFNHRRLSRLHASEGAHFVSALGITMILVQMISIAWGVQTHRLFVGVDNPHSYGSIFLTTTQVWTVTISTLSLFGFGGLIAYSRLGLRLRAMADDPEQFALFGYDAGRHRLAAFSLSGLLVAIASSLSSLQFGYGPTRGIDAVVLALVAVILGGRGSFLGPVLGAICLGVLRAEATWLVSIRWADFASFAILLVVLICLPHGLGGRKPRLEAES